VASVMTVSGSVEGHALGRVTMHEHLINDVELSAPPGFKSLVDVDLATREVKFLREAGGDSLVELTCRGLGRDVRKLRRISEATGLNIIASTGFYKEPYYPKEVEELTIVQLADLMTRELTDGIDDTGICAGIIGELGTNRHHVTPAQERVFRAAGRAQKRTGVAISTHTYWGGQLALEQVQILLDEGVAPNRIIIGHLGDTWVLDHYSDIARTGVFIQFDHNGIDWAQTDGARAEIVTAMVRRGFGGQMLLGCDVSYKPQLHEFGGHGYDHLLKCFVPELSRAGLGAEEIEKLLVDNPRRALTGPA
jgi:phosphotriesterase-related protein